MCARSVDARPFIGRRAELALLREALETAIKGQVQGVLIAGPPGIGKSRLLEEIAKVGKELGARSHRARCWEEGGAPAFWPWMQLVRSIGEEPRFSPPGGGEGPINSAEARFLLFVKTADRLVARSREAPRLLLVDDLHAADPLSLGMLLFLLSSVGDAALLVVAAYRDDEVSADPELATRFAELARVARTIRLQGLEAAEISDWVWRRIGTPPNRYFLEALIARTGGNPLFIDGLLRSLEKQVGSEGGGWPDPRDLPVPRELGAAIEAWVERVSPGARRILGQASAIGIEFEVDLLRGISHATPAEILDAFAEASAKGLLAQDSPLASRRRIGHALLRDALYQSLPEAERRDVEHRIVELLERRRVNHDEESLTRIAHHLLRSADPATAKRAVRYALEAASTCERHLAHADAARFSQGALSVGREFAIIDRREECRLLLEIGRQRLAAGDRLASRAAFRDAVGMARRLESWEMLARAAIGCVGGASPLTVDDEANGYIAEALEIVPAAEAGVRAELLLARADAVRWSSDERGFVAAVAEAKALAGAVPREVALQLLMQEVRGLALRDGPAYERDVADRARRELESAGDTQPALLGRVFLIRSDLENGRHLEAEEQAAKLARAPAHTHGGYAQWLSEVQRGRRAMVVGNFDDAAKAIQQAHGLGRWLDPSGDLVFTAQSFLLYRELEQLGPRPQLGDSLITILEATRHIANHGYAATYIRAAAGDLARATAELQAGASRHFADLHADRSAGPLVGALLAELCAEVGDAAAAQALDRQLERWSDRIAVAGEMAYGCLGAMSGYRGLLAAMRERWDEAERLFLDAIDRNQSIGAPLWAEHARCNLAWMLARRGTPGDRPRAEALLASVRSWAEPRGAKRLLRRAEAAEQLLRSTPAPALAVGSESPEIRFQREGHYWTIGDESRGVRLRDSKGLRYLETLLRHPGRSFWAAELVSILPEEEDARGSSDSRELSRRTLGHAGEILDAKAVQALRLRANEIKSELEAAASGSNGGGAAERLREELEFIERELRAGIGRGGQARHAADVQDRIRKAVTNRIRDAIRLIRKELPELGEHLDRCVKTGTQCCYEATSPRRWLL
jgi:hypothetical protein